MNLLRSRQSRVRSSRRDRLRGVQRFRPEGLDTFEDRVMMTVGLISAGTTNLTTSDFSGRSLANSVGFTAVAPVLSNDGQSILFGLNNTQGTGPITIGIASYLAQGTSSPVPLSTQILADVQTYTLTAGQSQTVSIPIHTCIQVDAFIQSTVLNGKTVGSAAIEHFNPIFDQPAYSMFAGPVTDAGYNTTGFIPTPTNTTPPAGTLGTLVSTTQTTGPLGGGPGDFCPPATIAGLVTADCFGTPIVQSGQEVDLTGVGPDGKSFTLVTSTDASGAYRFSVPYSSLPAKNLSVVLPLTSGTFAGSATPGTIDGKAVGTTSVASSAEKISGLALTYGASTGVGYNFQVQLPGTISGTVYADATGNGLQNDGTVPSNSGDTGLAGVTVQLLNSSGGVVATSTPTTSTGAYSFTGIAPGVYKVKELIPAGYQQTGAFPGSGGLTVGSCQVIANANFSLLPNCDTSKITNVSFTDVSASGVKTYNSLRGNTSQGDQVTANFTNSGNSPITVTLVTYAATSNFDLTKQTVFQVSTQTVAPGASANLTVQIPNSFYQIDFVCGPAITKFNPANNNTYHGENRFIDADNDGYENVPGSSLTPNYASLSGQVFLDKNLNGVFNPTAGERGIGGVTVQLTGTDVNNKPVSLVRITNTDGTYNFAGLQPGVYKVTEVQPQGYYSTKTSVGTVNGSTDGTVSSATSNTISQVNLAAGNNAVQYNYGEGVVGCGLGCHDLASAGYWDSCNGQSLINKLNGGPKATNLGNWLATAMPNLFSGLAGLTNSQVADYADSQVCWWYTKPNATILAAALSAYVSDSTLAGGNYASCYGFCVSAGGLGGGTINVGTTYSCWGGPTGTLTLNQFLQYADSVSGNGTLGGGDCKLAQALNYTLNCYI